MMNFLRTVMSHWCQLSGSDYATHRKGRNIPFRSLRGSKGYSEL